MFERRYFDSSEVDRFFVVVPRGAMKPMAISIFSFLTFLNSKVVLGVGSSGEVINIKFIQLYFALTVILDSGARSCDSRCLHFRHSLYRDRWNGDVFFPFAIIALSYTVFPFYSM